MNTAHKCPDVRIDFFSKFHDILRLEDRGCDVGGHHHIRLIFADDLLNLIVSKVVGHGINKSHLIVPCLFQCATDIGYPARRPVTGNFSSA